MSSHNKRKLFNGLRLAAFALLTASFSLLSAQSQSRLSGTVTDNSGAVIPGAAIVLTNVDTAIPKTAESNATGNFIFTYVEPGSYELKVEYEGFKSHTQSGITIETGFTREVTIVLEVGDMTETVTVEADVPLLESASSTVGQFIERDTVANMPVQSRRSASLVRLMGNISYRSEDGGEQVPKFSMAGGRSQNQMWTLDGSVVQNMSIGTQQLALNPPAESLQEFKAEANNYTAEYGRAGGGFIVMTTRSGTNEFHGAAYHFFRNDAMDARSFFAAQKAPLRYNIFGGSIGGPIVKNKTFFFFNYEGARRRDGVTYSGDDVPHIPERGGDFSNRENFTLNDPMGGSFPNNIIPQSRMDPLGRTIAGLYPDPNVSRSLANAPANNFVNNASNALTQNYYTTKVDHVFSDSDRINSRFVWVEAPQVIPGVFPEDFYDPRAGDRFNRHWNTTTNWIHNFSPTVINEFRFNWGDRLHINRSAARFSGKNGEFGIQGVNPESFARIGVNGLTTLVPGNQERIQNPIRTIEIVNNQTIVKGDHTVKWGINWRYARNIDDQNNQTGGVFNFGNRATGAGIAELLLGHVNTASINDSDLLDRRTDYYGVFVQDDWRVRSNLTLNLGLRWEADTPLWGKNNRINSFDLDEINPVSGLPGVVTFQGLGGLSKYTHDIYLKSFGPRFGFAYQAVGGLVVRGGYGINYYGAYAGAVPNAFAAGFSQQGNFSSVDGGLTQAFQLSSGMPSTSREELGPGFGAVEFGQGPRLAPQFLQRGQRNAMAQQWNLGVQKQLAGDFLVEVTYLANVGHRLSGGTRNLNQIPLVNGQGPASQAQTLRPYPHFANVDQRSPDWGNSSYHSGNLKIEKRYSNGFNMLVNYTWAKYLDDVESGSELAEFQGNGYQHNELRFLDKAYSGSDIRHRVALSAVYELPFGRGRKFDISNGVLNAIAGGWGVGIISELRTGSPYTVIENRNLSNTFSNSQRPNIEGAFPEERSAWRNNVKGETFFDTSAFSAPGQGIFGNSPRNYCCGPGLVNFDTSVHKWFNFTEQLRMQFRADFYNATNTPAFANPEERRGRGGFGRIASTLRGTGGRVSQLALRLEF